MRGKDKLWRQKYTKRWVCVNDMFICWENGLGFSKRVVGWDTIVSGIFILGKGIIGRTLMGREGAGCVDDELNIQM
jgi:hypothetical protein